MKKIISLLLAAVMLLSLSAVSAFAANGPMPTDPESWGGGARIGFSDYNSPNTAYVVNDHGEGLVIDNTVFPGASYDKSTNTLTLNNVDAQNHSLFIWYMGDDFKLKVEGTNNVGVIYVNNMFSIYNTILNIIGTGSLTVNENKEESVAISMWSEGDGGNARLSVADSVTLHLYAGGTSEDTVRVIATKAGTAAQAISVGGKGVDGVVGERVVYTDYEEANVMVVSNVDRQYTDGYVAKSKSDPTGKYSVSFWSEDGTRYVSHYVYVESLGLWVADPRFSGSSDQKSYTKEEFEKEYTIEQSSQPTKIRFTTDEREANKGWSVYQLKKDGKPDEVYGASPIWGSPGSTRDNPDSYTVYRLIWDAGQGIYVEDESFPYTNLTPVELEEAGYSFVSDTVEQQKTFRCWYNPAPFDEDNWQSSNEVMNRKSDPEGIYVQTGESYTKDEQGNRTNEKYIIQKVLYDAENDAYYVAERSTSSDTCFYVPFEEIGGEFSWATESVTRKKEIRYIDSYYNFNYYSYEAQLLEKDGDSSPFSAEPYRTAQGETYYSVHRLEKRENGHYYAVKWDPSESAVYGHDYTAEELTEKGFSFVMSDQDTPFTVTGSVSFGTYKKYTDDKGNTYAADWGDDVYAYADDDRAVTFGDTKFYYAEESDKDVSELISTEYEIETDLYSYYLRAKEYHHIDSGAAETYMIGDVDGDNEVTILDATALQRRLADIPTKSYNEKAADVDGEAGVSILDATAIQRWLAGFPGHESIGTYA